MEDVIELTNYIIYKMRGNCSKKQIQKILFYMYSLYLIKYNDEYSESMVKLFCEKIEFYKHGPVIKRVYDYLKNQSSFTNYKEVHLKTQKNENFANKVLLLLHPYSGLELENMTKNQWKDKYMEVISDKDIFEYYSNKYKPKQQKVYKKTY